MKLYRIAKAGHIRDVTGTGARMHGGRWNEKGYSVIYSSESLSLAALEYLVHLPLVLTPPDLSYLCFDIPDDVKITKVGKTRLPAGWDAKPFQQGTVKIGTDWIRAGRTLLLRAPSIIVPNEFNFLINPAHPDFAGIKVGRSKPFVFDERILERLG